MDSDLKKLIDEIKLHQPDVDVDVVDLAYDFAKKAHEGQSRFSGEPYFSHPYNAALILAQIKMSPTMIAAALLHDVPEETEITISQIKKEFGEDIAFLVEGVTKVGKVKYRGVERYIENLRKMFVAMAVDLRVIIIRFADRLDNLSTLQVHSREKQVRIAQESLEIYAPIANRLGMWEIRSRIEDAAFKYAIPDEYKWTVDLVAKKQQEQEKYLIKVKKHLEDELRKEGVDFVAVNGRVKHLYSLYLKLLRHDRDINKIRDLVALRVIVKSVADCYRVLGVVHHIWPPMQGRIKDYIAQPKANGYQSLHTTVFTEGKKVVEFQIRTEEMHERAEQGVAAHWYYDEKGKESFKPTEEMSWIQELAKWKKEIEENQKNLERLKVDVLKDRIFVFTPKGDVIDLPEESTPVDFAYAIHTDIGNKCSRAYVNDLIVNLDYKLKNGDIVEVLIDKNRKGPNPDWLKFVKSSMARTHIRAATKAEREGFLSKLIK
ncbi:MAG: RelA/SpoT family protein [Patescibacteria group bacterium]|jgi:GTP pyrophosphokinase